MESIIVSDLGRKVKTHWKIWTYEDEEHYRNGIFSNYSEIHGNLFLNQGSNAVWTALTAGIGTLYNNTNARIGVGDSTTAAVATQTGVIGTAFYLAMDGGFPALSGTGNSVVTFQGTAGGSVGNQAWNEFVIDNGTTAINRVVSSQGTKVSGQIRTVQVQLSLT